jgi:hypothetical protein
VLNQSQQYVTALVREGAQTQSSPDTPVLPGINETISMKGAERQAVSNRMADFDFSIEKLEALDPCEGECCIVLMIRANLVI